jgi:hypothetical protein
MSYNGSTLDRLNSEKTTNLGWLVNLKNLAGDSILN